MSLPPLHIRELMEAEIANAPGQLVRIIDYLLVTTDNHGGRNPAGWAGPWMSGPTFRSTGSTTTSPHGWSAQANSARELAAATG